MIGINTFMKKFLPTTLYIKTHNKTGLKYFGKTTSNDPYKYKGSGSYWLDHLKVKENGYFIGLKKVGCDVANEYTYYYEHPNGVFTAKGPKKRTLNYRTFTESHTVWREGPKGGVGIVKDQIHSRCGYYTTNPEVMKEFMWIKLQAKKCP